MSARMVGQERRTWPLRFWWQRLRDGEPHQVIGGESDGRPYMLRWYVIPKNPRCNVYVHKFLRSDEDRALHDHPWWFVSLVLRGAYVEHTDRGSHRRRVGTLAYRRAEHRHRVQLDSIAWPGGAQGEVPCWTLIVTGPKVRPWGFWCVEHLGLGRRVERFVPWRQWGAAGCGEFDA